MLAANIGVLAVQQAGGWRSDRMPLTYAAGVLVTDVARRNSRESTDELRDHTAPVEWTSM